MSGHIDRRDPVTVLALSGPLRLLDVPVVRGLLLKCLAECPAGVVVDLSALTVVQPVVLMVFPAVLNRAATWPAVPVVLAAPSEATLAALHRSSVTRTVPVRATLDEAVEAARTGSAPLGRLRIHLRPTDAAAAEARRFMRDACAAWSLEGVVDEATVIVTELVDNAARHARTELVVTLAYRGIYLNIAVSDGAPEPARKRTDASAPGYSLPGKGLRLVDAFATAWGTLPTEDGKTTWATVRVG
ncbi:STAS domain-containing protein [Cryptosporangium japonicum]|uniref:ATP-binding protein n=1 Tax=Cryptosporangium japonicum TaxID=80872 RepID=A0ABP3DIZ4_9ACTN